MTSVCKRLKEKVLTVLILRNYVPEEEINLHFLHMLEIQVASLPFEMGQPLVEGS
jgi:hypothetical protein